MDVPSSTILSDIRRSVVGIAVIILMIVLDTLKFRKCKLYLLCKYIACVVFNADITCKLQKNVKVEGAGKTHLKLTCD